MASNLWVAVGSGGTGNRIVTSSDGNTWTSTGSIVIGPNAIAYKNNLWVAVGGGGGGNTIATSTDGVLWTGRGTTMFSGGYGYSVAFGNNLWVAVGAGTGNTFASSTDGITWTTRTSSLSSGYGVAYGKDGSGNGLWVAVGSHPTLPNTIATSTNGITWTNRSGFGYRSGVGVAYGKDGLGNGLWVAVGNIQVLGEHAIMTSSDGITWMGRNSTILNNGNGVAYGQDGSGAGLWVAVGRALYTNSIATSYDGITWTGRTGATGVTGQGKSVTYANGLWVATFEGANSIATSTNGINWTVKNNPLINGAYGVVGPTKATLLTNYYLPTKKMGDASFNIIPPTSNNYGAITYTSSNTAVATIVGSKINVVGVGTSTITAVQEETFSYLSGTNTATFQVIQSTVGTETVLTDFSVPTKIIGDASFNLVAPTTNSDGSFVYTSSNTAVATIVGSTVTIVGVGTSTISAIQLMTSDYATATVTAPFVVNQITSVLTNFSVPTKTFGDVSFGIVAPTTNGNGAFSYASSDTTVATISGDRITVVGGGSSTITATQASTTNYTSATITAPLTVNQATTVLSNFVIGPKTIADASFGIVAPTTNSTGVFTYTSSDPAVATIVGNVATIVGIGSATITADQASNANYLAQTISTTFQVSNNLWVAVGQGGNTVASSSDGILWKGLGVTGFSNIAQSIAYSNNLWVAVGNGIHTLAYSTTNGNTWTGFGSTIFSTRGYRILYDPDAALWIAIGQGGNSIATSTTPKTSWTGQGLIFPSATCVYGPATNYSGAQNLSAYLLGGYSTGSLLANSLDGTTWQMGTTSGLACQGFNTIAYGNGVYVAGGTPIGTGNSFATSTDQISWTGQGGSTNMTNVNQITYGNGIFIAVGTKGTAGSTIMKSTDGITWTNLTNVYGSYLGRCVAYYQGRWIVGGSAYYGINYSDNNGTTWTLSSTSSYNMYSTQTNAIACGNDIVVSVGQGTGNTLAISTDLGISWTGKGLLLSGSGNDIKYIDGVWLAVGGDNVSTGNIIVKSTDNGTTWTQVATSSTSYFTSLNSVQNVNGTWYISGRGAYYLAYSNTSNPASISDFVFVSTVSFTTNGASLSTFNYQKPKYIVGGKGMKGSVTGLSWFDILNQPFTTVNDVYWNGTIWVGVGSGRNTLGYSYDGINWIGIGATIFGTSGNNVYYSTTNSLWIATGTGTNTLATSVDGINWTGRGNVFTTAGGKITYYNNLLIGVGEGSSKIASSTNGISWDTNARITTGRTVAYINNQWVVAGDGETFATSTDGIIWRDLKPTVTNGVGSIYSIAYGNGRWVAVGYGKMMYSTDGINWTGSASNGGISGYVYKVAYGQDGSGNGLWVAAGSGYSNPISNCIATSTDGITWTSRNTNSNFPFNSNGNFGARGVAYGNGLWVAVGIGTNAMGANSIATSTNGITWTSRNSNGFSNGQGVTYANGLWVAVGNGGTSTSTDGITWTGRSSYGYYDAGANVAYGNGLWVSVGYGQSFTSPDGITWTARAHKLTSGYDVAYSNGLWVICGYAGSNTTFVSTSTDGITWTLRNENVFTYRGYDVVGPANSVTKVTTVLSNFSVPVKTFGDASFELVAPTTNSDGVITYTSSNTAVATIVDNVVTILNSGTSIITANQASTSNYSMGTISTTFTVNKITTVLTDFSVPTKTFGDASFSLVAPTTTRDGYFGYTSSNTAVATIVGNTVTIVGGGTATITAVEFTIANYTSGTITATFTVNQATTVLSNFSAITKTFGNAAFALVAPTTNSNGSFTYTSSDTSIATIVGSTVTIVGAGTATITATQASTANFLSNSITTTLTVNPGPPTISIFDVPTKAIGNAPFNLITPTSNSTGTFTYTSSNESVATIDGSIITIVGLGNSTITAVQASTTNYISGTISRTFSVLNKVPLSIATGQGANSIATSTDLGFTWTGQGSTIFTTAGYGVAGPATYDVSTVTVDVLFAAGPTLKKSTDGGKSWGNLTSIASLGFTSIRNVTIANGLWVISGQGGNHSIATSFNEGLTWTGYGQQLYQGNKVVYANGLWVMGGSNGSGGNAIATSTDAITWTVHNTAYVIDAVYGLAYGKDGSGNGLWIAGGTGNNTILTSNNGTVWTGRGKTVFTGQLDDIVYANDLWVAVGSGGLATSTDGMNWTNRSVSARRVAYGKDGSGNSMWVTVSSGGNFATSYNAITWTARTTTAIYPNGSCLSLIYANNVWVTTTSDGYIVTSLDGFLWTNRGYNYVKDCLAYAQYTYTKPTYVAVGAGITNQTLIGSTDGINWTQYPYNQPFSTAGYGVAWNGVNWIAVGKGENTIVSSDDGINWTGYSVLYVQGNDVVYGKDGSGNGLWVAAGEGGSAIATSPNGKIWTVGIGSTIFYYGISTGVAYGKDGSGNGLWAAVGYALGNTIATSRNGTTWTGLGSIMFSNQATGITYANNLWVAVGKGGNSIATSRNGTTWTGLGTSVFTTQGNSVRYTNNLWVATGEGGNTMATSVDGTVWTGRGTTVFTMAGKGLMGPTTAEPMLSFSVPFKNLGDAPFAIVTPTTNSTGAFTYTSSNTSVATIDGNTITIVGMGTSVITAVQASTDFFIQGTISKNLIVDNYKPTITDFAAITKTFGDASFNIVPPTSNSSGIFTYTSSNLAVATIVGNVMTIVGGGTATITATQGITTDYTSGTIATTLVVNQKTTVLSNFSEITKTFGNAAFALVAPTTNSTGSFTYTSSNPAVATIVGTTVTIVGGGIATITANQASNTNFLAQTITATLTVNQATPAIPNFDIPAKVIGTAPFVIVPPVTNGNGAFTYTTSDESVATINGTTVTIVGLGITTITAIQASTANYISGTISAPLAVVTKIPLSIATGQGGNSIATSTDLGFTWTGRGTTLSSGYGVAGPATYDVSTAYANFWITGGWGSGGNTFATSTDGITLTGVGQISNHIYGYACANNLLVLVGGGYSMSSIAYSTNGITWNNGVGDVFAGSYYGTGYSVAYGAGLWVAAGNGGNTIATSTNGINWVGRGSPVTYSGRGVAFGKDGSNNNLWVVVGAEGSGNRIASSPDGITWTVRSADYAIFSTSNGVAFGKDGSGNNLWVAVGTINTIATSTNGTVWTGRGASVFTTQGWAVAYGQNGSGAGLWVAVGEGGNSIATSTDGLNWTGRGTTIFTNFGRGVAYANNQWFAVGNGGNFYATSVDGINWTGRGGSNVFVGAYPSVSCVAYAQLEYAKPTYVAVGTGTNTIVGSTNGTTWSSPYPSPFTTGGTGVAWNGMQWVAVGSGGNTIAYSADGIRWTGNNTIITSVANAVAYGKDSSGNGLWVAGGYGGNNIATSTNGIVWTGRASTAGSWGLAYGKDGSGNGLWVSVGGGNTITTSSNGFVWTVRTVPVFTTIGYAVTYANNLWVAVGQGGNTIATSVNGTTWTGLGSTVFTTQGNGIRYTNNLWVATGQGGNTLATSLDGTNWVGRGSTLFTTAGRGLIGPTAVEPTLTFTVPIKNIGDAPFTITPPTSNSTGSFTYTSSNPAVATIDGTTVTIVGMGTSAITVVQASTDFFISRTVSTNLVVENVKPTLTNFSVPAKTFGDASFSLVAPTSESIGAFSYTSSNTAVAIVSGTTITIVGGGTATITANQENTVDYGSTSIAAPLVVSQAVPVIANFSAITKTFGNAAFGIINPTTNSTGSFTYTSSDAAVATIIGNTVTIVGAGVATITAIQASTANYISGSITTTLTVGQATPTMTNFVVAAKTFGNAAFAVIAPTTNSTGLITYTSSNAAVATIVGNTITIVGAGSSTITASQESTANYLSGSISAIFNVSKATTVLSSFTAITKTFGDASFGIITPTTNSDGTFTYTSSNTAVATVSGSTVTIVGGGSATITAIQATSTNYLAGSIGTTLTVNKATTVLSNFSVPTKTVGNAAFALVAPTSNSTGSFSYTSSNTAIARITGSTITIVAAGSVTITATQATTTNHLAASTTAPFTVNQATILSNFSVPANKLVGDVFTLALPTSNSPGAFTYTSSNTAVATIDGNVLTVVGGGSSTISAIQASSGNYASATITATITITQITTVLSNFSIPAKRVGDADAITPPTTNSNGAFTYTSSNTAVATIVGNTITCVGVGTATITANQGSNPTYTPASITTTVQVTQGTLTLSNFSVATKTVLDAAFSVVAPTTNSIGAITYTSSNPAVATVNANTITIVGLGSTTITATQATTVNYTSATISTVFQVIKAMPGLTGFSVPTKTIGNASFAMTPPTSSSNGAFTYTSSNPQVATFIGNQLAIRGVGTATISAVQATTATYFSETITASFQVDLITTVLSNFVFLPKTFGDIPFKVQASSNSGAAITYTSSDTAVITIVGDMATIVGAGTTTITASQASTSNFASATITETITVSPITTVLNNFAVLGKRFGDASFNISPPSSNSNGAFTYTSSNTAVATIAGSTVSIVGAGTSTITANQASTTNYSSGTATSTFTVVQATPILSGFSVPEKTFGSASFTITPPSTNSNGLFAYTSSNLSVATVAGNVVTIVAAGSCTITAIQASTANYTSGIITAPFVVSKSSPNLRNFGVPEKTFGSAAFALVPPTTNGPGAFTYTSSNTEVATIAGSMITIVGIGTSMITAVQATTVNFLTETTTATFNVIPGISTLTNFSVPAKTIGDASFGLVAPTTKSDGAFTYTSSNTAVATIDGSTVIIVGPGTSTITAVQASTTNFASAMISALFTVNRIPTVLSGFSAITKIFGDASFGLVPPTTNSDGAITYTSSNTAVATIVGSTVSIVGAGTSTITASQANTSVYASATLTAILTVNRANTVLSGFSVPAKIIGEADFVLVPPTTNSNGAFTYTSSNPAVATIVGNTVTLVGLGVSTITAVQAATANYTSRTITAILPVSLIPTALTNFVVPAKTIGDAAFNLDPPTSNSTGAFTYSSSNLLIARLEGDVVTIVGTGSCIISATQASTSNSTAGTITATFVVGKAETILTNFVVPEKSFANAPFALVPPSTNSNGPITYTSSNTDVATISRNMVTIVGVGTSTITANQASTVNYPSGTISTTFTVTQGTPAITNFSVPAKTIGDASFSLVTPSSNSLGDFTYTSSNTEVATIDGSMVTIVGAGTSSITANQASTTQFLSGSTIGLFTVNRIITVLTGFSVPEKSFGDASFSLVPPTSNSDGLITYTSSNPAVATIEGDVVTIVGAGNATITAVQSGTPTYRSASITALLKVNQIKTILTEFSVPEKIIGDASFTIDPPITNGDGAFTYTSRNPAVATIEGNVVTIVGLGETIITAVQASTNNYTADTMTTLFQVKVIRTVLANFSVPAKTVGDAAFTVIPPTSNSDGPITYTSSNRLVATVEGDVVTIVGTGNVTISALQQSTFNSTAAKISASLIVNKAANTISWFSIPEQTFGAAPFTIIPPTTASNGAFTYTSSNPNVATIVRNVVTIVGIGTSTITGVQAATVNYHSGTITATLTVDEGTPGLSNFSVPAKTVADASFGLVPPTSRSDGAFTYTSSDPEVATIEGSTVTIVGVGISTITATQASTAIFASGTITATLTVNQITTVLTNFSAITKTFGDASFSLVAPTSNSDGAITYTSSNTEVATIEDDIVTIVEAGSAIITATQESTDDYTSATITAFIQVNRVKTILTHFVVPSKIFGEADFTLIPPTTESDGIITYTSSDPEVATIDDDVVTIVGLGTCRITANQESTVNYTSDAISALFNVGLIKTELTDFLIPEKAIGSEPFTLDPPTSNSDGDFTYTSSNRSVAMIDGNTVTIVGVGTATITAIQASTPNSTAGTITASLVVGKALSTITDFVLPEKAFGNAAFTIIPPTSNSNGTFTYSSSNTAVATIARNVITIVGVGTSTITAVQATTSAYISGTITTTFTVIPGTAILSNFSVPTKIARDASFSIVSPRTNSDGEFSYTSSNTEVATIEGSIITILGAGTSTITANQASNERYTSGTISTTFTVNPITTVLSNFSIVSKALGDASFSLVPPTTNSDGAFTYTSSKLSVATIDGDTVTIVGGGTATITAVQASTSNYTSATITGVFRVSSLTTVLSNFTVPTKAVGDASFALVPPTTNGDGAFTYSSSNTAVATVAANMVTIVGAGTSTITAVQSSTENYTSATITASLVANKGTPVITNFTMPIKEIGMFDFFIIDPSSASTGAFTYTSSNIKVATIFKNTVSIKGVGTSTITATQAISANYNDVTVTTPFVVNQMSPTLTTNFVVPATKAMGDAKFKLIPPKSNSISPFAFTSSNTAVATIAKDMVTIVGAGTVTISATQPSTKSYGSKTVTGTMVVNPKTTVLSNFSIARRIIGAAPFAIAAPTTTGNGLITYTSSNPSVATVAGNMITLVGVGSSTITASQASTANFTSGTISTTLMVNLPTPLVSALQITNKSMTNPSFTIVDPTKPNNNTGTWTYTSSENATISGNEVTLLQPGIVTITGTLSSDSLYNSRILMTQFSISDINVAPSSFVFIRSADVEAAIPATVPALLNTVIPLTVSSKPNIATFNPTLGTIDEKQANQSMIVNALLNMFPLALTISVPTPLLYVPPAFNKAKLKNIKLVRPAGTTVESPLIINTIAADSAVGFLCSIVEYGAGVQLNGVGSFLGSFIKIARGLNNKYLVVRSLKGVSTSSVGTNGDVISFAGITAIIGY